MQQLWRKAAINSALQTRSWACTVVKDAQHGQEWVIRAIRTVNPQTNVMASDQLAFELKSAASDRGGRRAVIAGSCCQQFTHTGLPSNDARVSLLKVSPRGN